MHRRLSMNRSILLKYIVSYVGLVLFTFSLLVTVSCYATVRRLHTEILKHQEYQLKLLADDLLKRRDIMQEVALDIAITFEFKPISFTRNAYYETFLIEKLAMYEGVTRLDRGYFLLYNAYDMLYTKDAKYSPNIYFAHQFNLLDDQALTRSLKEMRAFTILRGHPLPEGVQLWCLPIRLMGVQAELAPVTLAFIVDQAAFSQYMADVVGDFSGGISLWYEGEPVLSAGEAPPLQWQEDLYRVQAGDSGFSLWMRKRPMNSVEGMSQFILSNLWLFCAFLVLAVLLGVLLAYRNFKPIQKTATLWGHGEQSVGDELNGLQLAFVRYDQKIKESSKRIEDQLHLLRRQMLSLLLSGKPPDLQDEVAQALGLRLPHARYCVAAVYADAGTDASEALIAQAAQQIENDALRCYAGFSAEAGCIAVLLNMASADARMDDAHRLLAACEALGLSVLMGVGQSCASVSRLQASFLEAISALNAAGNVPIRFYEQLAQREDAMTGYNEAMEALLHGMRRGDDLGAQSQLDTLIFQIEEQTPSILLRCYLCTRVLNEIIQEADRMGLPVPREQIGWIHMSTSTGAYHDGIAELLWMFCDSARNAASQQEEQLQEALLCYVDAHCLDYALSLDMLSEHFSLSPSQISRIFRQWTGEAFKDYVVRKRIACAKRILLREDITVAQLCARVGYSNVSHFIKLFREQVGLTPAAYKKEVQHGDHVSIGRILGAADAGGRHGEPDDQPAYPGGHRLAGHAEPDAGGTEAR